ncbi:unnamed protein product [Phytophthora lilii]|uniref:Unnamed protein product n=1 Tax=Phytophthora lilii TaxID=2077276 RepID=A0A9W6TV11_9STRA|nr:unnamed protein product [Phytophthora lilii]
MAQKSTAPHSMEQNPDLSAFEIMMLLSCLLRLHNQDFHAHDIPQLSGLVCGVVVKSGEYVWASRDEIVQHKNDIVLAADHSPLKRANDSLDAEVHGAIVSAPATLHAPGLTETLPPVIPIPPKHGLPSAHSTKANLQEDKIATKGVLQAMRRRLSSSKSSVPIADVQRYILKIIGARGLRVSGKQSLYCICRFDTPGGVTLLQIQTSPHPNSGNTPSWSSQLFEVALPVESAHDATITFIVKHGNPVGSTRIAQGSTNFVALTPGESTTEEVCLVKKDKPAGTLQFSLEAFA